MQLPLQIRLGWRNNETRARRTHDMTSSDITTDWINFHARHYLFYLSLTGRLRLDWGWLLGIGVLKPWTVAESLRLPLFEQADALAARHRELGLTTKPCRHGVHCGVARLALHRADPDLSTLTIDDVEELRDAIRCAATISGIPEVLGGRLDTTRLQWSHRAFATGVAPYHAGVIDELPKREVTRPRVPLSTVPRIAVVMNRYVAERSLIDSKSSVDQTRAALHRLSAWLAAEHPTVESLAELTRPDLLDFLAWMTNQRKLKHPDQELSVSYRKMVAWQINAFFRYGFNAEWDDVPARPPLSTADVPRGVQKVPRYIPEHELEPLMDGIRALECPLQRCALLIARWSGARRSEIRKLHLDCLDTYPDGTHRIRLAAGKSRKERIVPIHPEAAAAIERSWLRSDAGRSTARSLIQSSVDRFAGCSCTTVASPARITSSHSRCNGYAPRSACSKTTEKLRYMHTGSDTRSAPSSPEGR